MAMKKANARQKKFMSDVIEWSNDSIHLLYGEKYYKAMCQIHHVIGRSSKQNKVPIGHDFILPVPFHLHDVSSNHDLNVTHRKKAFTAHFGTQRYLFSMLCDSMKDQGYAIPSIKVIDAIMSTCE